MGLRKMGVLLAVIFLVAPAATHAQFPIFGGRNSFQAPNTVQTERDTIRTDASRAYQKREYTKALEISNQLLTTDPRDFVALHLRASARIELGREEGSPEKVREGIEDARVSLGIAGQRYPWLYVPYFYGLSSLAEMENRAEHAELAIKIAGPVLARADLSKNDRGSLLYQRALCQTARKDQLAAIKDFAEAIKNSPEMVPAYINRAELLVLTGQTKDATEAYDAIVQHFPNDPLAFNYRGKFRRTQGNLDGAIADFSQALKLGETAVDYVNRGMCLLETNDPLAAEGDLSQALKLDPKLDFVYRFRGNARAAQGNVDGALQDFDTAVRLDADNIAVLEDRGFSRYFKKDYAGAAADFDKVLSRDPQAFRLAQWLYVALLRGGKAQDAAQLFDSRLKGKVPVNTWNATMCAYLQDRSTEQQLLKAAQDKDAKYQASKLCEAHFFIGQKKAAIGANEEAKAHFRESEKTGVFSLAAFRGSRYELANFKKE